MAIISDMGVNQGRMMQPFHKNKWRLEFPKMGGDGQGITVNCVTAERPKVEQETITVDRYNSRTYLAGKFTVRPITVVLEPDIGGEAARVIEETYALCQKFTSPNGEPQLPHAIAGQDYKFPVILKMLTGQDATSVLETFRLRGAWFSDIDWGDVDYSTGETVKVTLTITYDLFSHEITGISKKAVGGN